LLVLIFPLAVGVGDFANLIRLEEQHLSDAFVGIDARWQRRCIGYFQGDVALPFRLKRSYIDDQAATRVSALAQADGDDVARDAKIFDGLGQDERVRGDDADVAGEINEGLGVEVLGVDDGRVNVCEYLELAGDAYIVAIGRQAIRNDAVANLPIDERLDAPRLL